MHRPECCEASLQYLDVDYIDHYYQHRVDTSVPIENTALPTATTQNEEMRKARPQRTQHSSALPPATTDATDNDKCTRHIPITAAAYQRNPELFLCKSPK